MAKEPKESKDAITDALSTLLADSYTLYLKTHNYHWNVQGPMFMTLHTLFETQYRELATAVDGIAERVRTLGAFAPGSYSAFAKLSKVKEETGHPKAEEMIANLVDDHKQVAKTAQKVVDLANDNGDDATADFATQRIESHQKAAWMLRSHLL